MEGQTFATLARAVKTKWRDGLNKWVRDRWRIFVVIFILLFSGIAKRMKGLKGLILMVRLLTRVLNVTTITHLTRHEAYTQSVENREREDHVWPFLILVLN